MTSRLPTSPGLVAAVNVENAPRIRGSARHCERRRGRVASARISQVEDVAFEDAAIRLRDIVDEQGR